MGVMPYVAKTNYSYHSSLGLDKFPGGCMNKCTVYNWYLQFTINIFINNSLQLSHVLCLFRLLILVIYDNVNVVACIVKAWEN